MDLKFRCPACGFLGFERKPFKNIPDNPYPLTVKPPYENHWGEPVYDPCSCCGFEPGNEDSYGVTLMQYLEDWFTNGMVWLDPKRRPANWDIVKQLEEANFPVPEIIKLSRQLKSGR